MKTLRTGEVTRGILEKPMIGCPFLLTSITPRLRRLFNEAGYRYCNLNLELSKVLLGVPQDARPPVIQSKVKEIFTEYGSAVFCDNITMLMNPAYRLDVIRFFCELARAHSIAVVWPCLAEGNTLVYAEPDAPDYKRYRLAEYDVILIR